MFPSKFNAQFREKKNSEAFSSISSKIKRLFVKQGKERCRVCLICPEECREIASCLATLEPFLFFFTIILYLWHLLTQSASRITAGTTLYKTIKKTNTLEQWLGCWLANTLNTQRAAISSAPCKSSSH